MPSVFDSIGELNFNLNQNPLAKVRVADNITTGNFFSEGVPPEYRGQTAHVRPPEVLNAGGDMALLIGAAALVAFLLLKKGVI